MDMFFIDRMMCSDICPCAEDQKYHWEKKFAEKDLHARKRTWTQVGTMPITPMTFVGPDAKNRDGSPVKTFDTFDQCYQ